MAKLPHDPLVDNEVWFVDIWVEAVEVSRTLCSGVGGMVTCYGVVEDRDGGAMRLMSSMGVRDDLDEE